MSYQKDRPIGSISPFDQAPIIQGNYAAYNTSFSVNHSSLNNINQGKHEAVVMERQTADPDVIQDLCVLYNKNANSKAGIQPQLFLRMIKYLPTALDTNTPENDPMQLTYNSVNVAGPVYQSFLAGGYLIYFGSTTNIANPVILTPAPTTLLIAIASPNTLTTAGSTLPFGASTVIDTVLNDRFTIFSDLNTPNPPPPYNFQWFAIGTV